MRGISILRLYYIKYIVVIELTNLEIILKEIEENIAIWKESTKMFRALRHSPFSS